MVIEGDEYPSSFFDKEPKFLHYTPFALILTNLEYDHADIYPDISSLKEVFKKLINLVPEEGIIVYNYDDKNLKEVINSSSPKAKLISYGRNPKAHFVLLESKTSFKNSCFINSVLADTPFEKALKFSISIPGEYNALNALSVLALLYGLNFLNNKWTKAFKNFPGIKRRQEIIYADNKLFIVDDFAHHPTAVKETLKELKKVIEPEKTVIIFEPRTNSSKRKVFQKDYIKSLSLADVVYIKIPPGLENIPEEERLDIEYVIEALKKESLKVFLWEKKLKYGIISGGKFLILFMSSAYFEELKNLKKILFDSRKL
ncbi:hypothetical protein DRN73_05180 [Candidatus Pacearchaeota archaeon]|nr:MAG: hypothetical protein DRN73_05180 [Candidatus Pacearchaeota archaeon]